MKNMIRIRNSVIIVLCITIVLLGIGFIVLSVDLKKKNDEIPVLKTVFTKINKTSSVKGSDKEPISKVDIINGGSELDFKFKLNSAHDEITYVATIENQGNLPCEIVDVMESPDYSLNEFQKLISPVSITMTNIKGKIIPPGESYELKLVVYYNVKDNLQSTPKEFTYKIGLITKSR